MSKRNPLTDVIARKPLRDWITLQYYSARRFLMKPGLIPQLLEELRGHSIHDTEATNPYRKSAPAKNLHAYLSLLCRSRCNGYLFVADFPTTNGTAATGIPFCDAMSLESGIHPFLRTLRPLIDLEGCPRSSQKTRWTYFFWKELARKRSLPAFWYAYTYEPPRENDPAPSLPSMTQYGRGLIALRLLVRIYRPHTIVSLGIRIAPSLQASFPNLKHLAFPDPTQGDSIRFLAEYRALNLP